MRDHADPRSSKTDPISTLNARIDRLIFEGWTSIMNA